MMSRLRLAAGDVVLEGAVTEENPRTAEMILEELPIEGSANRWGDEIYFSTPLEIPGENGRQDVEVGELAFWPRGRAIAVFFGATPVSTSDKPRAYEDVNVFGSLLGDVRMLSRVRDGDRVLLERI